MVHPHQAQTMVCLLNFICPWVVHAPFWFQLVTINSFSFFPFFPLCGCHFEHPFMNLLKSHPKTPTFISLLVITNYALSLHFIVNLAQIILPLYHLGSTLLRTTNDNQFFFLCFHMVFNNSSLFMSVSNLI